MILRTRNTRDKGKKNENTYFMFNNFSSKNRVVYEIIWKNMTQPDGPQITM